MPPLDLHEEYRRLIRNISDTYAQCEKYIVDKPIDNLTSGSRLDLSEMMLDYKSHKAALQELTDFRQQHPNFMTGNLNN